MSKLQSNLKPRTYIGYVRKAFDALGSGEIRHHMPTDYNSVGQSGAHTFVDDIVMLCTTVDPDSGDLPSPSEMTRRIHAYLRL